MSHLLTQKRSTKSAIVVFCFSSANFTHLHDATNYEELLHLHLARHREKGECGTSSLSEARIWAEPEDKANRPALFTSGGVEARDARTAKTTPTRRRLDRGVHRDTFSSASEEFTRTRRRQQEALNVLSTFNIRKRYTIFGAGYFTMQLKLSYHGVAIGDCLHTVVLHVRSIRLVYVRL